MKDDAIKNAAWGKSAEEIVEITNDGENWNFDEKLAIIREYWSLIRVNGVFLLGMAFAFCIFSILVLALYDLPYYFGESRGLLARLAGLLFGLGIGAVIGRFIPHGIKVCTKGAPGVDENMEGKQCVYDQMCTTSNNIVYGACSYPASSTFMIMIRWAGYLSFGAGIVLMIILATKGGAEGEFAVCKDPELKCLKGLVCEKGLCRVKPDCTDDSECPKDFICSEKKCMEKGKARENDFWFSLFIGFGFGYILNYFLGH